MQNIKATLKMLLDRCKIRLKEAGKCRVGFRELVLLCVYMYVCLYFEIRVLFPVLAQWERNLNGTVPCFCFHRDIHLEGKHAHALAFKGRHAHARTHASYRTKWIDKPMMMRIIPLLLLHQTSEHVSTLQNKQVSALAIAKEDTAGGRRGDARTTGR